MNNTEANQLIILAADLQKKQDELPLTLLKYGKVTKCDYGEYYLYYVKSSPALIIYKNVNLEKVYNENSFSVEFKASQVFRYVGNYEHLNKKVNNE